MTRGTGGVLASGVSISGDTDASPDGGTVVFSGSSLTPTYECVYDVGVTTAIKGLVQGSYSDVLTVTIANN